MEKKKISPKKAFLEGGPQGGRGAPPPPPPKPGKITKDREQLTAQPAIRIDTRRKFKFLLNFSKFFLKFP